MLPVGWGGSSAGWACLFGGKGRSGVPGGLSLPVGRDGSPGRESSFFSGKRRFVMPGGLSLPVGRDGSPGRELSFFGEKRRSVVPGALVLRREDIVPRPGGHLSSAGRGSRSASGCPVRAGRNRRILPTFRPSALPVFSLSVGVRLSERRRLQTLNRKCMTSPSRTTYSLPSMRQLARPRGPSPRRRASRSPPTR